MKALSGLVTALTLLAAPAAHANAARALVDEFVLMTQSVTKVESNVYEVAYDNELRVTSSCYVSAYAETAVVTHTRIIFIDANEVCSIIDTKPKE